MIWFDYILRSIEYIITTTFLGSMCNVTGQSNCQYSSPPPTPAKSKKSMRVDMMFFNIDSILPPLSCLLYIVWFPLCILQSAAESKYLFGFLLITASGTEKKVLINYAGRCYWTFFTGHILVNYIRLMIGRRYQECADEFITEIDIWYPKGLDVTWAWLSTLTRPIEMLDTITYVDTFYRAIH